MHINSIFGKVEVGCLTRTSLICAWLITLVLSHVTPVFGKKVRKKVFALKQR
jgi:hypothetical protein